MNSFLVTLKHQLQVSDIDKVTSSKVDVFLVLATNLVYTLNSLQIINLL